MEDVGENRLIPLKAHAWLGLGERKSGSESVDSKYIRKHANDVIRLSQLLLPERRQVSGALGAGYASSL
jgi:hypothetical protein